MVCGPGRRNASATGRCMARTRFCAPLAGTSSRAQRPTPPTHTCMSLGQNPASTAARLAPTAPPRRSARRSSVLKFSALFSARPPHTTTCRCRAGGAERTGRSGSSSTCIAQLRVQMHAR
jgi:hypothetical protein